MENILLNHLSHSHLTNCNCKLCFRRKERKMQQFNIDELKPHPRNNEFFDDISGEKWEELLESIRKRIKDNKRGNIEPIIITQDKVIVSGHQRVRAFKELKIPTIEAEIRIYKSEDDVLLDLLESNIRRRGEIGGSAKKVGKRIKELERLYGIQNGSSSFQGNQYEVVTNKSEAPKKTQEQLAAQMGISVDTLQNYKMLADMIPELDELVTTGIVTKTTALAMMRNLSEDEQVELISSMDTTKKITKNEVQKYINEIKQLKENPPIPSDYESTKRELQDYKKDYKNLMTQFDEKVSELQSLRKQIENMKITEPTEQYNKKLKDSTIFFCSKVADFIEKTGGYVWLTDHLNELPDYEKKSYISAVNAVYSWADTLLKNINN